MPEVTKTLDEMSREVVAWCREKGWYDSPVSFGTAVALVHEEVSEAGHAWRHYGFEDATRFSEHLHDDDGTVEGCPGCFEAPKPEGVGSELADVLIRLLDYTARFDLSLPRPAALDGGFPFRKEFLDNIRRLHALVSQAGEYWDLGDEQQAGSRLATALRFAVSLAGYCGIDIYAEYERKMAYNRTRPYRNGGLRA